MINTDTRYPLAWWVSGIDILRVFDHLSCFLKRKITLVFSYRDWVHYFNRLAWTFFRLRYQIMHHVRILFLLNRKCDLLLREVRLQLRPWESMEVFLVIAGYIPWLISRWVEVIKLKRSWWKTKHIWTFSLSSVYEFRHWARSLRLLGADMEWTISPSQSWVFLSWYTSILLMLAIVHDLVYSGESASSHVIWI